ncbi:hypothetical protein [Conexibacter sp. S30A1]|uniref:hypothetical protein n=1 Tax=Conexibacter sp. S30A1 TaxID=2937800 RepID=UPI00200FEB20|nr:hypothetical protein [Conexibacter sp. S30A1]
MATTASPKKPDRPQRQAIRLRTYENFRLSVCGHADNRRAVAVGGTDAADPRHPADPEAGEPLTAWQSGRSLGRLSGATKVLLVRLGEGHMKVLVEHQSPLGAGLSYTGCPVL